MIPQDSLNDEHYCWKMSWRLVQDVIHAIDNSQLSNGVNGTHVYEDWSSEYELEFWDPVFISID